MGWATKGAFELLLLSTLSGCAFVIRTAPVLLSDSTSEESFGLRQLGLGTFPRSGPYDSFGDDICQTITRDASNNVYCGGYTYGALGEANGGDGDAFIAKYDSSGVLQWVRQLGSVSAPLGASSGDDYCQGITTDTSGNVYCGGYTTGSLGEANGGSADAFIAKYNSSGTLLWVRQLGSVSAPAGASSVNEICNGITTDSFGNIYCGGNTNSSLAEANGGGSDAFIAKYNSLGILQWVRQLGSMSAPSGASGGNDSCNSIATDTSGNIYCAGQTYGSLGEANGGLFDAFIAKYNSSGTLQWVRQLGSVSAPSGASIGNDSCNSIATDTSANVYCGGYTTGSLGEANGGSADVFIWGIQASDL